MRRARKVRLLREFDPAARATRPRRPRPVLRRAARLRRRPGPDRGGRRRAAGGAPAAVSVPAARSARRAARRVAGGDINEAWRSSWRRRAGVRQDAPRAPAGEYAAEAAGLAWLGEAGGLRVPRVLGQSERFLALEWIQPGRWTPPGRRSLVADSPPSISGRRAFGAPVAAASGRGRVGQRTGRRLGDVLRRAAAAPPRGDGARPWRAEHRGRRRRRAGLRSDGPARRSAGAARAPARRPVVGQRAGRRRRPALADRSRGLRRHREIDLAMLALFGRPSPRTLAAYDEVWPRADGHAGRIELYHLLPLLVHAVLFGGRTGRRRARGPPLRLSVAWTSACAIAPASSPAPPRDSAWPSPRAWSRRARAS